MSKNENGIQCSHNFNSFVSVSNLSDVLAEYKFLFSIKKKYYMSLNTDRIKRIE